MFSNLSHNQFEIKSSRTSKRGSSEMRMYTTPPFTTCSTTVFHFIYERYCSSKYTFTFYPNNNQGYIVVI